MAKLVKIDGDSPGTGKCLRKECGYAGPLELSAHSGKPQCPECSTLSVELFNPTAAQQFKVPAAATGSMADARNKATVMSDAFSKATTQLREAKV